MPAPKQTPILRGRIEAGRVVWGGIDGKRFEALKAYLEGQEVEVTIQKRRKKTTMPQRKYYFAVIVAMIAEAAGYDPSEHRTEVHEALKLRFLRVPGDGPLEITRSTESLTTAEREEYHENCRRFAAEFYGVYIPLPNEMESL